MTTLFFNTWFDKFQYHAIFFNGVYQHSTWFHHSSFFSQSYSSIPMHLLPIYCVCLWSGILRIQSLHCLPISVGINKWKVKPFLNKICPRRFNYNITLYLLCILPLIKCKHFSIKYGSNIPNIKLLLLNKRFACIPV